MVTTADSNWWVLMEADVQTANWWVLTSANVDVSRCLDLGTVRVRVRGRSRCRRKHENG